MSLSLIRVYGHKCTPLRTSFMTQGPLETMSKTLAAGGPTVPAKWHGLTDKLRS